jgi:hypothetical protein
MNEQQLLEQAFNSITTICENKVDMEDEIWKLVYEVSEYSDTNTLINPAWIEFELTEILKRYSKQQ